MDPFENILDDAKQYGEGIVVNLDGPGEATLNRNFQHVEAVAKDLVYTNGLAS